MNSFIKREKVRKGYYSPNFLSHIGIPTRVIKLSCLINSLYKQGRYIDRLNNLVTTNLSPCFICVSNRGFRHFLPLTGIFIPFNAFFQNLTILYILNSLVY